MKIMQGEEIFESDECYENISTDNFQISLTSRVPPEDTECIIKTAINPEESFSFFNGKLFEIPRTEYSVANVIERRVESPLQRFSRLRSELDDLKTDLDNMVENESNTNNSVWSLLQHETKKLILSTQALEAHPGFGAGLQKDHLDIAPDCVKPDDSTSVRICSATDKELLQLESRVHKLEVTLGYTQNNCTTDDWINNNKFGKTYSPFPLVKSISAIEQRVAMLDTSNLESVRSKVQVLKSDLDAALKVKSVASDIKVVEASRRIEELANGVSRLEGVAEDLPALVLRLKTLEKIHLSAGTFSSRLTEMETGLQGLLGDLNSNKEVLGAIKEGFTENLKIIQQNMASVDNRLSALA